MIAYLVLAAPIPEVDMIALGNLLLTVLDSLSLVGR
jgi:hypothetical protein